MPVLVVIIRVPPALHSQDRHALGSIAWSAGPVVRLNPALAGEECPAARMDSAAPSAHDRAPRPTRALRASTAMVPRAAIWG